LLYFIPAVLIAKFRYEFRNQPEELKSVEIDTDDQLIENDGLFNLWGDIITVFEHEEEQKMEVTSEPDYYDQMVNGDLDGDDQHMSQFGTREEPIPESDMEVEFPPLTEYTNERLWDWDDASGLSSKESKKKIEDDELAEIETCASSQVDPDECK